MVCISLVRHSQKIHNQFSDLSSLTGRRHLCWLYSSKTMSRDTQKSPNNHIEWVWIQKIWRNKEGSLPTFICCSLGKSYSCSFTGAWCFAKHHYSYKSSSLGALWCADFLSVFSPADSQSPARAEATATNGPAGNSNHWSFTGNWEQTYLHNETRWEQIQSSGYNTDSGCNIVLYRKAYDNSLTVKPDFHVEVTKEVDCGKNDHT